MSAERLRFSTAILRLLGEELNPAPDQGILELIKNAYDADATECVVELKGAHIPGGSLRVWDNGTGLTSKEIRDGWLVVGDSLKSRRNMSPGGRPLVGNKGLGRLAALRLGKKVTLVSRPKDEPDSEYRVELDWRRFDQVNVVEEVELEIAQNSRQLGTKQGTEVIVDELPAPWREGEVRRLARAILLLTDPFQPPAAFRAILRAPEFEEIAARAHEGYFNECDFHLVAQLDDEGHAMAEVRNAGGDELFRAGHETIADDRSRKRYYAPSARFELWEFLLASGRSFSTKGVKLPDVKRWLNEFGGVRFYHRDMRVLPYGDPKNDWLDMNLRRVRSPEERPSTNNSLGAVWVSDPKGVLQQKTDRSAFVENKEFSELRQFACDVLDWMAGERLRQRETRRKAERERVHQQRRTADEGMRQVLSQLPPDSQRLVNEALQKVQTAHEAEVNLLADTALLYYSLGTVGTTAAAFAHQTKHPLGAIVEDANALENWLGNPNELPLFREVSSRAVKRIKLEADAIYTFADVTLKLLEHEKRRSKRHEIHDLIDCAVRLLEPYVEARQAKVERDFATENPHIWCSRAAFEAIVTNFITNSLQAFANAQREGDQRVLDEPRRILLRTRVQNEKVILTVMDNGPGIEGISVDDVWLPGKTTTEKGTGLGLTIVRDVVLDLGGIVEAASHGELGGAKFMVTLPLKK